MIVLLTLSASLSAAQAQTQLGGAPLPPSMGAGPIAAPGSSPSFNVGRSGTGRTILVPSMPSNLDSFSNRVQDCVAAGAAAGVTPNGVGAFTRSCAN
jgi:hypothetical protein